MVPIQTDVVVSIPRMGNPSSVFWHYLFGEFLVGAILVGFLWLLTFVESFLPKPPRDLTGKVVVVTGATSTLGKTIADEFARNGCTIIRVDGGTISEESSTDVSSTRSPSEPDGSYMCDLRNVKAIRELADTIDREIDGIDVLVTCAGHAGQDILDTISVTLMSHYWTVLAFLPSLLKRERSHVVGVTPNSDPEDGYAGSRAAIAGLMETLSQDFGGRSSCINFITLASKADTRLEGQSERLIAEDIVRAVRRDRCTFIENWCMPLLDRLSHPIRAGITTATRWLYPRDCEYSL